MSTRHSLLVIILSGLLELLWAPWLPLFGVTLPLTGLAIASLWRQLSSNGILWGGLSVGYLHDVWLGATAGSILLSWLLVVLAVVILRRWLHQRVILFDTLLIGSISILGVPLISIILQPASD